MIVPGHTAPMETHIMRFTLYIRTGSTAFDDPPNIETARILRDIAERLEAGEDFNFYETLQDINGNDVGRAKFTMEDN